MSSVKGVWREWFGLNPLTRLLWSKSLVRKCFIICSFTFSYRFLRKQKELRQTCSWTGRRGVGVGGHQVFRPTYTMQLYCLL